MPEDDQGKLPPGSDVLAGSVDTNEEHHLPAQVEAMVEARLAQALERLREQNRAQLRALAARSLRTWKFFAILLLFLGTAGWAFALYDLFFEEPERAREWIRQEVGERMAEQDLREVAKDTVRSEVSEFVDEQLASLRERTNQLEARIEEAVTKLLETPGYAAAAHWNLSGRYVTDSVSTPGPAFGWLDGHGEILAGGRVRVSCGLGDISHFREVTAKFPYYPFPYWALAVCLKEKGDESWIRYAQTGRTHGLRVTQVPTHDESHDMILAQLEQMLGDSDG